MQTQTYQIPNITCGHCVRAIQDELSEVTGVRKVDGDPETREIQVQFEEPATTETIMARLKEINYPAAS